LTEIATQVTAAKAAITTAKGTFDKTGTALATATIVKVKD